MENAYRVWILYDIVFSLDFLFVKTHWILKIVQLKNLYIFKMS